MLDWIALMVSVLSAGVGLNVFVLSTRKEDRHDVPVMAIAVIALSLLSVGVSLLLS